MTTLVPNLSSEARPLALASDVVARVTQSARTSVEQGLHKLEFRAMSTDCQIKLHGVSAAVARDFQRDAVAWVAHFEARYSRFIPDSLIGRINAAAGTHWVDTDPEADRLFNLCQELFFFTRGSFDPTALPLIKLWIGNSARRLFLTMPPFKPPARSWAGTKFSGGPAAFFCRNPAWRSTSAVSARNTPWTASSTWPSSTEFPMCWWTSGRTCVCAAMRRTKNIG
jgi:ApbE family